MYLERPKFKGHLKLLILSLLEEEPMHGYAIMQKLSERFGIPTPSAGAIYPILASLRRSRLIEVAGEGERDKKVYRITEKGLEYLELHEEELQEAITKAELFKEFVELGGREVGSALHLVLESLPELSDEQKKELSHAMREFARRVKLILLGGD
ncbi:PadR family transcriptional regulator [Thermococcus sp. CX2]|uniref:PadR family transcriptional regulator n=1 Tax=Thermococcus sp. CX2 TaxID=163006 RepID=UPI00352FF049